MKPYLSAIGSTVRSALWNRYLPWGVVVFGLIVTALVTLQMKKNVENAEKQEFSVHCDELHMIISDRLGDQSRILMSGVALFNASDSVTRREWRIFSQTQKLDKLLPGVQGFGFALLIGNSELSDHIQKIRSEGFPEYEVKPEGEREVYSSIIYLEPFSGRNLRAFGYDMLTEPVRRAAMERARDTDSPTLSGKVILVQETDRDVQPGTLMYVPIYRNGMPTDSVEQRRAAIYGWVYSPYRMNDLMKGTLECINPDKKNIKIKIYDGYDTSPQNLLYENSLANDGRDFSAADLTQQVPVDFNGHRWTLLFTKISDSFFMAKYLKVWFAMFGGLLIILLLFSLVKALLRTPVEAQKIAGKLTLELREKSTLLSGLLASIPDIVFFKNRDGVYLGCNPAFARLVNRKEDEIVGLTDYELFEKDIADFFREQDRIMMEMGTPRHNEESIRYPDGEHATIDTFKAPLRNAEGRMIGMLGVSRNITERKWAEKRLKDSLLYARSLIESSIDPMVTISSDGKITDLNMATVKITGVSREKLIGTDFTDYFTDPEKAHDGYRKAFEDGQVIDYPLTLRHVSGKVTEVLYNASVYRNGKGEIIGVFAAARDITLQKQLEDKLKSSEKNFRTFFQSVDDIIVVASVDGRIMFANEAFTSKLGYASEKLENLRILDMHPPEKRNEAAGIFGAMLRGERDFCPLPLQTKDGRLLPVETRIWFGKWNEEECIFGISKDLSVQQAALEKFEKFFRSNPVLMSVNSLKDRKYLDVNDSFLKKLAFTRNEVIGKTAMDLNIIQEPEKYMTIFNEFYTVGSVKGIEIKILNKNGDSLECIFSSEIIDSQGEKFCLSAMVDLTDQKKTEALLLRTVEMKKLLMELSSQYINIHLNEVDSAIQSSLGKMGRFVASGRAYVFSYDFERGTTSNDYEWCEMGIEPQIDNLKDVPLDLIPDWVSAHRKGQYVHIEDVSKLPQGGLKETLEPHGIRSLLAVPMMSGNECIGFVGFDTVDGHYVYTDKEISLLSLFSQMLVNVKSRVKTEKSLIEANSLLEASTAKSGELAKQAMIASTAKSRFLAHMSHEIRTPLNAILGFSQLMQYDLELSPAQKQRVDTINRSGKHLLNLLNDILELSKIEAGNLSVTSVSFDLHCLINDVLLLFRSRMEDKNLTTAVYDLEKVPKYLVADEQKLRQVIINLLSNAVKYTVSGGVSLRVNVQDGGPDATRLVILVEDTGPGITAEEMEQLFLPFEQTSTGCKSGTGSGLGLAISRQFARIMGGDVTVVSELGKGSVFRFDIPVKTGAAQSDTGNRRVLRLEAGQPKFRILIAEDDNDSKNFLVQMLDNIGFEVVQVSNGNEAVEAFISGKPQLILMDDSMPVMRGDEAIRLIRKSPGGASVKILALTANASEETRQRFITAGTDDFMAKPFSQSDLFEKIRILSGIRYVYSDSCKEERITQESVPVLTKEEMDSLPADLRQQIRAATISCRHDQLLKLIQQVTEIAPETGETLRNMALRFDYNALIKLLN